MQNILVLGSTGMLGQALVRVSKYYEFEVFTGCRNGSCNFYLNAINPADTLKRLLSFIEENEIEVIINSIGMLVEDSKLNFAEAVQVNGFFPYELGQFCDSHNVKLIHISTDCVYSGASGPITRNQIPDPKDEYGVSKYIGEFVAKFAMVLRTSIIGIDNSSNPQGLLNWVLSQNGGSVNGYTNAYWSGLTTDYLAHFIFDNIIISDKFNKGLYNVSTNCVSKFELINKIVKYAGLSIDVKEFKLNDEIDKCLISDYKDIVDIDAQLKQIFE